MEFKISTYDIYRLSLSKIFEEVEDDTDFKLHFPSFLDTALMECLPYENQLRRVTNYLHRKDAGFIPLEMLSDAPVFIGKEPSETDIVEYHPRLTRISIPYAIASLYFQDDGELNLSTVYRNRYAQSLADLGGALEEEILDYGCND